MNANNTKAEIVAHLVEKGQDEAELKKMNKKELLEVVAKFADEQPPAGDKPPVDKKPEGLMPPIKEKVQARKMPQMKVPSTKMVTVIGKKYCNVIGGYVEKGKECQIPESSHESLVKAGTADKLYTLKK